MMRLICKELQALTGSWTAGMLILTIATGATAAAIASGPSRSPSPPAGTEQPPAALDPMAGKAVAEQLAQALADQYAHADAGQKMAQVIRAKLAAGAYDSMTSGQDLAHALNADVHTVVSDKHLNVGFGAPPGMMMREPPSPGMLARLRAQNGGIRRVQILPGNIGYLEWNGSPLPLEMTRAAIVAAFAFLHNTDALIFDLRGNHGSDPRTVALYMSYLSAGKPYVVNAIHYRAGNIQQSETTDLGELSYGNQKPVFCLTSHETFSGGEELAYDIQAFKRGLIVGETTGGGANPGTIRPLSHGFFVFLPAGYAVHPVTGTNWEGVGVKPDVEVASEQAVGEAQRRAVDVLKAGATDQRERATFEALALQLQTSTQSADGADGARGRLTAAQIVGRYVSAGDPGPSILEKDGQLFLQPPRAAPPSRLIPLGGARYRLEGMPEDFSAAFTNKEGKVQLLLQLGNWPPIVAEKK